MVVNMRTLCFLAAVPAVVGAFTCPEAWKDGSTSAKCAGAASESCNALQCCVVDVSYAAPTPTPPKCSSHTCPAGQKLIASADTTDGVLDLTCCVGDETTCGPNAVAIGLRIAYCQLLLPLGDKIYSMKQNGHKYGDDETTCCSEKSAATCFDYNDLVKTCDAGTYRDASKDDIQIGATDSTFQSTCCKAKAKCSDFSCSTGKTKTLAADLLTCDELLDQGASCSDSKCCGWESGKCGAIIVLTCPSGEVRGNMGSAAGTTSDENKKNCCENPMMCKDFSTSDEVDFALPGASPFVGVVGISVVLTAAWTIV